jgi:hypothetical protein
VVVGPVSLTIDPIDILGMEGERFARRRAQKDVSRATISAPAFPGIEGKLVRGCCDAPSKGFAHLLLSTAEMAETRVRAPGVVNDKSEMVITSGRPHFPFLAL